MAAQASQEARDELEALQAIYPDLLSVEGDGRWALDLGRFRLQVTLPAEYPAAPLEAHLRCDDAPRHEQATLNASLAAYAQTLSGSGDPYVMELVQWVQESAEDFVSPPPASSSASSAPDPDQEQEQGAGAGPGVEVAVATFNHLLEGKQHAKEAAMVSLAKDLGLTGSIVWGTPGIVAVVGPPEDVREYWAGCRKAGKKGSVVFSSVEGGGGGGGRPGLVTVQNMSDLNPLLQVAGSQQTIQQLLGFSSSSS